MDYISYLRSMVGHEKVIMVVAGVLVFDQENRVLLHLRADNQTWGLPGGFMEMGETISDTARREALEETGLKLGKLELFSIYSGPDKEKVLPNGDEVAMVQHWFTCEDFEGELVKENEESLDTGFFALNELPENLFASHVAIIEEFKTTKERPIIR